MSKPAKTDKKPTATAAAVRNPKEEDPFLSTTGEEEGRRVTREEESRATTDALDEFERRLSTGQPAHSPKKKSKPAVSPPLKAPRPAARPSANPIASHPTDGRRRMSTDRKEVEDNLNDEIDEVRRLGEENGSDSD